MKKYIVDLVSMYDGQEFSEKIVVSTSDENRIIVPNLVDLSVKDFKDNYDLIGHDRWDSFSGKAYHKGFVEEITEHEYSVLLKFLRTVELG